MNAFMVAVLAAAVTFSVVQATRNTYRTNPSECRSAELMHGTPEPDTALVEGCTCSGSSEDSQCSVHPHGCTCSASPEPHCSVHTHGCVCTGSLLSRCSCPRPRHSSSLPPSRQRLCCSGPPTATPPQDACQEMVPCPEMRTSCPDPHCSDPSHCPGHGPAPRAPVPAHSPTRPCPCSPPCQFCGPSAAVSGPSDDDEDVVDSCPILPKSVSVVQKPVSCTGNRPPVQSYHPRMWSAGSSGSPQPYHFYH